MESLAYWKAELSNKASGTQAKYLEYFNRFIAYTQKTPDELIAQRRIDLKADDPREQRGAENLLRGFMVQLKTEGKSPATQQIAFAAVKSFYDSNEYPLRTKRSDYPKGESIGSRVITKAAIKQILEDIAHMKDKKKMQALVMFLKDAGTGVSDVRNFNYGHIRKGLEANQDFIQLQFLRQKTQSIAKPVIGPEAIAALKAYLKERQMGTRRIAPEELTDSSPLFRTNYDGPVERISRSGLSSMVRFHCCRTGEVKLSAHSFRKFVQTNLDLAGVSPNIIDRLLGHKLINSRDPYSQPSDEQLLDAYKKAYPMLRVYPEKVEVEERVTKLEGQLNEKNAVIASLVENGREKETELGVLKQEFEQLKQSLEPILHIAERQLGVYKRTRDFNVEIAPRLEAKKSPLAKEARQDAESLQIRADKLEKELTAVKEKLKKAKE